MGPERGTSNDGERVSSWAAPDNGSGEEAPALRLTATLALIQTLVIAAAMIVMIAVTRRLGAQRLD